MGASANLVDVSETWHLHKRKQTRSGMSSPQKAWLLLLEIPTFGVRCGSWSHTLPCRVSVESLRVPRNERHPSVLPGHGPADGGHESAPVTYAWHQHHLGHLQRPEERRNRLCKCPETCAALWLGSASRHVRRLAVIRDCKGSAGNSNAHFSAKARLSVKWAECCINISRLPAVLLIHLGF